MRLTGAKRLEVKMLGIVERVLGVAVSSERVPMSAVLWVELVNLAFFGFGLGWGCGGVCGRGRWEG